VFLLKLFLLAGLISYEPYCFFILFAFPISGRAAAALVPVICPPLSETGLGALAKGSALGRALSGALTAVLLWLALSAGIIMLSFFLGFRIDAFPFFAEEGFWRSGRLIRYLLLSVLPFLAVFTAFPVARLYRKGIGGYTGDTLGAAIEIGETVHLALVFALCRASFFYFK
jgi:adenosylcobinamide-GDP ribazoletransferase